MSGGVFFFFSLRLDRYPGCTVAFGSGRHPGFRDYLAPGGVGHIAVLCWPLRFNGGILHTSHIFGPFICFQENLDCTQNHRNLKLMPNNNFYLETPFVTQGNYNK